VLSSNTLKRRKSGQSKLKLLWGHCTGSSSTARLGRQICSPTNSNSLNLVPCLWDSKLLWSCPGPQITCNCHWATWSSKISDCDSLGWLWVELSWRGAVRGVVVNQVVAFWIRDFGCHLCGNRACSTTLALLLRLGN